jgi:hypothetical protein
VLIFFTVARCLRSKTVAQSAAAVASIGAASRATRARGAAAPSCNSPATSDEMEDDSDNGKTLHMFNRWRAHVFTAVARCLRSKTVAQSAAALAKTVAQSAAAVASIGASSRATRARGAAAPSCNSPATSDEMEDDSDNGKTLHMFNRWRAHVLDAEQKVLGFGSSDDDEYSPSSSPPSSPGIDFHEFCPEDEPFEEDEKVVAEWRMNSYATSTIVRIVFSSCCHVSNLVQGEASGALKKLKAWYASHAQKASFGELRKPFSRFLGGSRRWMGP